MWRFYDSSGRVKQNTKPTISLVTSLPSSPVDGDECILTDSLTAGTYQWHLRYVSARASNKWVFVGGTPLRQEVLTSETTASTTYTDLATTGPSITIPVAGDYVIRHGATITSTAASNNDMSFAIGAATATTLEQCLVGTDGTATVFTTGIRVQRKSLAAVALVAKYKVSAGTGTFVYRFIEATPIAIGG